MKTILVTEEELQQLIENSVRKVLAEKSPVQVRVEKEIMNVEETSEFLNRSRHTIYQYTSRKEIPFYKVGKLLNFRRTELIAWLEQGKKLTKDEIKNSVVIKMKNPSIKKSKNK